MTFKRGIEYKIGMRNRMTWLLLVEINRLYDSVFLFCDETKRPEFDRLRKYLMDKINCE